MVCKIALTSSGAISTRRSIDGCSVTVGLFALVSARLAGVLPVKLVREI